MTGRLKMHLAVPGTIATDVPICGSDRQNPLPVTDNPRRATCKQCLRWAHRYYKAPSPENQRLLALDGPAPKVAS